MRIVINVDYQYLLMWIILAVRIFHDIKNITIFNVHDNLLERNITCLF